MKRSLVFISTFLTFSLMVSGFSKAGPFQDDLVRCIFDNTSVSDEIVLARWMVASFATHDGVRDLVDLKPEAVKSTSEQFAVLVNRIILKDCAQEMKRAAKT